MTFTKGHRHSLSIKMKIGQANRSALKKFYKNGGLPWNKGGATYTVEMRRNISVAQKKRFENEVAWNKGKKMVGVYRQNYLEALKHRAVLTGEKNPNWKGNLAKRKDQRNDPLYKQWRLKILRNDNYRCMICGETKKGEMQADHINSWTKYPRLRYEIENGQTLCRECHAIKTKFELRKSSDVIFATSY